MLIRFCGCLWPRNQKVATRPEFLSSRSVLCPTTNMLISPTTSAEFRIRFKLACLTYKALSTSKPTYLHALLTPYTPPRCLLSSGTRLLAEPRYRTDMGSRAFHFSAPREWNRLPLSLRSSNLPSKSFLKLIISSWLSTNWKFNWNSLGGWLFAPQIHISVWPCARYKFELCFVL